MKNPHYFKLFLFFAFIAILGCSKKEDPIGVAVEDLSIVLTSDVGTGELEVVTEGQMVNFTVTGSDEVDYTSTAKLYVNDVEISSASHPFTTTGTFAVKAVLGDITSNILNFEVLSETQRALTIDVNRAFRNQTITFGLLDSNGENSAADATFYVNSAAISGFTFSSASEGSFEVYAKYMVNGEEYTSATKNFSVFIPKKNVVLEDYTGTWCGFCLDAIVAVETVKSLTDHVTVVAIHKESGGVFEPLHFDRIDELQAEFGVPDGFPQTQLDRATNWKKVPSYDYDAVMALAGVETDMSIAINSQITGSNLTVDVKVVYENGSEPGDKLVVYLLENGVIADQVNYFNNVAGHPYQGAGNPIKDFEHNEGLRNTLSDLFGDPIPDTPAYQEFKKSYSFNVPSDYNAANLSLAVMVVKADNAAKNSQHAEIGQSKDYQ